jgi:hypothetical protein
MNTTNNITTFLESIYIVDTHLQNPSYEKIFTLLSENEGVSYYISRDMKSTLTLESIDLIQLNGIVGIRIDGFNISCTTCLLPFNLLKKIEICDNENSLHRAYTLSIKNRSLLKKMVNGLYFNQEGLCFDKERFIGIYKKVPELDTRIETICHDECD